jgi:hypothetical protein
MTRKELLQRGVDSEYIKEVKIYLDDMIESRYEDEEAFFSNYCYEFDYPKYPHKIHYFITGTNGKYINVLVWTEKGDN